jgi:hypothetical protein
MIGRAQKTQQSLASTFSRKTLGRTLAHSLGRLLHQLPQDLQWVNAKSVCDVDKLDDVEAAFPALKLGNVGLWPSEAFCQLPLGQARTFPCLD